MSLSSAMNVGVSGLGINAEAITVVGNNIANVNTVGFKEGRTIFSDMLSATLATGQVGRGGQIQVIQNNFSQGSFENTSGANDLAIQGDSFFVLQDSAGAQSFSRAGAFDYNDKQILTNPNGLQTLGYGINQTTGKSNGTLGAIDKSKFSTMAASATTSAAMMLNLDSTQTIPGVTQTSIIGLSGSFGATTPPTTQTATQIFDEFGVAHTMAITWGGTSPNYTYSATISGVQTGTPGSSGSPITGTLNYPTITNPPTQTLTFSNGAKSQPLTLNCTNIQNSGAAVAPSAVQNGSAGQQTGMVAVTGGMNAAGITAASSQTGSFALTPGTAASVTGATTTKNSATLVATGTATLKNSTSLSNTATLTSGSNQIIVASTTGLMVGMDVVDTTLGAHLTVPSKITAIDTLNKIVTLSAPALASAVGDNITYKSNVITNGTNTISGVDTTGLTVGMAISDSTTAGNIQTAAPPTLSLIHI